MIDFQTCELWKYSQASFSRFIRLLLLDLARSFRALSRNEQSRAPTSSLQERGRIRPLPLLGLENTAFVVASNQGASLANYPPFSWPGGSMIVDFDGRILAQADPGPGEKIVVSSIDIAALRAERERRTGHHMLGHLRTESHRLARRPIYPGSVAGVQQLSIESNKVAISEGKRRLDDLTGEK